jgi:hypothetical protein
VAGPWRTHGSLQAGSYSLYKIRPVGQGPVGRVLESKLDPRGPTAQRRSSGAWEAVGFQIFGSYDDGASTAYHIEQTFADQNCDGGS